MGGGVSKKALEDAQAEVAAARADAARWRAGHGLLWLDKRERFLVARVHRRTAAGDGSALSQRRVGGARRLF